MQHNDIVDDLAVETDHVIAVERLENVAAIARFDDYLLRCFVEDECKRKSHLTFSRLCHRSAGDVSELSQRPLFVDYSPLVFRRRIRWREEVHCVGDLRKE